MHKIAVTLSFTPWGDHQTGFIAMKIYLLFIYVKLRVTAILCILFDFSVYNIKLCFKASSTLCLARLYLQLFILIYIYLYWMFIYRGVKHKKIVVSSLLLLRLFHQSLPYLKSNIRELAADTTDKVAFEKVRQVSCKGVLWLLELVHNQVIIMHLFLLNSQQQELSSKVFAHLCDVVDDEKQCYDETIHQISKLIILEGKRPSTCK